MAKIARARRMARNISARTPGSRKQHKALLDVIAAQAGLVVEREVLGTDVGGSYSAGVARINSAQRATTQRLALAQMVGHHVMHGGSSFAYRAGGGSSSEHMEAAAFAGELLMPDEVVRTVFAASAERRLVEDSGIRRMARRFGVSQHQMSLRLLELGLATSAMG